MKEGYPLFQELGAEVLAISADGLSSHAGFARREGGFPFPLASDPDLEVIRRYGVLDESGKHARRAIFVIQQDGTILHAIPRYSPANLEQFQSIFIALGLA